MITIEPLYFVNILVGVTLAGCTAFVAIGRERDLLVWAAGFALYPVAFLMLGLRGQIPDPVSIIIGNGALALMFASFTEGLCRLYGFKIPRVLIWSTPPVVVLGFALLLDNFEARVALFAVLVTYQSLLVIFIVIRSVSTTEGRGKWIIFAAITLSSLMFLARSLPLSAGITSGTNFLAPGFTQTFYFSIGMVCLIMFAIGVLVKYKERAERALLLLALHDPLTKLGNRRILEEKIDIALKHSASEGDYGALMMLDLDYFKDLNDTHGHAIGDQLLIEVASRLKNVVNDCDTVARLGGDEFVVLLERLGNDRFRAHDMAHKIAERAFTRLTQPYHLECNNEGVSEGRKIEYKLSISIGVALFPGKDVNRTMLFSSADAAMYRAKQSGRNCVIFQDSKSAL